MRAGILNEVACIKMTTDIKPNFISLAAERSQLDEELSRLSLDSKNFTNDEIRYAMKELSAYDIIDSKAKSALLDCFVKRVEIGTEGNITVEYDLFGYETGFTMGSEAFKEVRKNPALLRHLKFNTEKSVFFLSIFHLLKGMIALTHIFIKS